MRQATEIQANELGFVKINSCCASKENINSEEAAHRMGENAHIRRWASFRQRTQRFAPRVHTRVVQTPELEAPRVHRQTEGDPNAVHPAGRMAVNLKGCRTCDTRNDTEGP